MFHRQLDTSSSLQAPSEGTAAAETSQPMSPGKEQSSSSGLFTPLPTRAKRSEAPSSTCIRLGPVSRIGNTVSKPRRGRASSKGKGTQEELPEVVIELEDGRTVNIADSKQAKTALQGTVKDAARERLQALQAHLGTLLAQLD